MKIDHEHLNLSKYIQDANTVKEIVLEKLVDEKLLDATNANNFCDKFQIIVFKRNWFKRWLNKFNPNSDGNDYIFKIVKFEN